MVGQAVVHADGGATGSLSVSVTVTRSCIVDVRTGAPVDVRCTRTVQPTPDPVISNAPVASGALTPASGPSTASNGHVVTIQF